MKTKYIFLNPEGVIRPGRNGQGWDPKCVENLCIVIGMTGAFIVLTGEMKESPSGSPWPFGDRVVGSIQQPNGLTLSDRIAVFLEEHPCQEYVIIDTAEHFPWVEDPHLALCDPAKGLLGEEVDKATELLGLPENRSGNEDFVWDIDVSLWRPSQIYYRFHDTQGKRWMIYMRWRHSDPWSAELLRCDEEGWRFPDGEDEWQDLLEEEIHIPGTISHYYRDYEFAFLMEYALDKVRSMFPDVRFPEQWR